jgi:hypothetical protein
LFVPETEEKETLMSRGYGQVQRDILAVLRANDRLMDTFVIAAMVYDVKPGDHGLRILNDAQLVSIRRALVKLADEGEIFKVMRGHNKRAYWASERTAAHYRKPGGGFSPDGRL